MTSNEFPVHHQYRSATLIKFHDKGEQLVIGWREWLSIPAFRVDMIKAKVDSGARTSTIHAYSIRPFADRGRPHVSFVLHPRQGHSRPAVDCTAEVIDERYITSSSGHRQRRQVIRVDVGLGGRLWPIELTLANRDMMGFRMLLGREALRRRFLIDTSRSYIAGRSYADVSTAIVNIPHGKHRK